MPFIEVKTNVVVPKEKEIAVKARLGQAIAIIPTKSEKGLMVCITPEQKMYYRGEDVPCAFINTKLKLSSEIKYLTEFTKELVNIMNEELEIPRDNVYMTYDQYPFWGSHETLS